MSEETLTVDYAERAERIAREYRAKDYVGCPYCGEDIFEKVFQDNEPSDAAEELFHYTCSDCGRVWTEVFWKPGVILDNGVYAVD